MYQDIYHTAVDLLKPPDLVIYLQASVPSLLERIDKRGRDYEKKIDVEYLQRLNLRYNEWAENFQRAPFDHSHGRCSVSG